MWTYESVSPGNDYLAHHGILGMKWGVRRYQNKDGTLTGEGKKHYGSSDGNNHPSVLNRALKAHRANKYKKMAESANREITAGESNRYFKAYNSAADEWNTKYSAKFDKKHKSTDSDYDEALSKAFDNVMNKHYSKALAEDIMSNEKFRKAAEYANKYGLEKYSSLAADNKDFIDVAQKYLDGKITYEQFSGEAKKH